MKAYLDEWARKLQTLEWLPWRDQHGCQIELKVEHGEQGQSAAHDRYWAKYQIYQNCGWPGKFDKDDFARKQDDFNAKAHG